MGSILKLMPLIREGVQNTNGTSKSKRHFLDFVVDGKSLWEALGKRHDMVSILCAEYSANETAKALGRLLLDQKADLPNDRRSFFVCSEVRRLGVRSDNRSDRETSRNNYVESVRLREHLRRQDFARCLRHSWPFHVRCNGLPAYPYTGDGPSPMRGELNVGPVPTSPVSAYQDLG